MKNETEACTIIKNSFILNGAWAYKIPDISSDFTMTIQRPFDIIAISKYKTFCIEVKHQNSLKSFDLKRIKDHQIENLDLIKQINPYVQCLIMLTVNEGPRDKRLYVFDDIEELKNRRIDDKNYLKKDLELMKYYVIRSGIVQNFDLVDGN